MILVSTAPAGAESGAVEMPQTPAPQGQMTWTWSAPWLGREWTLTDTASPVMKMAGAQGVGQVDPTHWWSEAPTVDGSQWEGFRTGRGEVFIPLLVSSDTYDGFEVEHEAFMQTLDPRQEGVLRVTRPNGRWREIGCRYTSGAEMTADWDVTTSLAATYGVTWATADPYWRGQEVVARFQNAIATRLLPAPPFVLSAGQTLANATVTNPGDVESYALWRIEGPFSSFSVGVGDSLVDVALPKFAGEYVEIDMRPRRLTITDETGADRWDNVTDVVFSEIPPGKTPLTVVVNGSGAGSAVTLTFTPRYRRAW